MKDRLETARQQADTLALAIGSVMSKEVGEAAQSIRSKVVEAVTDLDKELRALYGVSDPVDSARLEPSRSETTNEPPQPPRDDPLLRNPGVLKKLDDGFTKLTGKRSGAPWSSAGIPTPGRR